MKYRFPSVLLTLLSLLGLTVGTSSCTASSATLPAAPGATTLPATTTTLVVPASWSVPVAAGASCPATHAATFGTQIWNDYLTALATGQGLSNPASATLTGLRLEFPSGCYYLNAPLSFDFVHPLVDVEFDGAYTNNAALSPQFIQTNVPSCSTGTSILRVQNNSSQRVELTGLTIQGSAPNNPPYCGDYPGGLAIGGNNGSSGPHHVSLISNTIHNTWGDGIYVSVVDHMQALSNVVTYSGRASMTLTAGNDITVRGNTFEHAAGMAFNIETNAGLGDVSRVLAENNSASYAAAAATDASNNNGGLWNASAAGQTTISDVMFRNNTSKSSLELWTSLQTSNGYTGVIHRVAFEGNTTTSASGRITAYGGDNVTITNNQILGGPPVQLGSWTDNPPTIYLAVPPFVSPAVCGTMSGNGYADGSGGTVGFRVAEEYMPGATYGYTMPSC